jgi:hypothetical protein
MTHRYKNQPQDEQAAQTGKAENDHNKQGLEKPTQKNEGQRTVRSRHDREAQIGGSNQSQMRHNTSPGNGKGPERR